MNIKSDATEFISEEEVKLEKPKVNEKKNNFFWMMTIIIGGLLMYAGLIMPEVKGIVAFIVFFIGLNRVDAAIDYFRGVDDKKPVGEKDIL